MRYPVLAAVLFAAVAKADTSAGLMTVVAEPVSHSQGYRVERSYWGSLTPARQVQAGFRIAGQVGTVAVRLGQSFAENDVLAQLDTARAEAGREVAAAQLEVARQNLALAERTLVRLQRLDRNGYATEADLDSAERSLKIQRAQLEVAQHQLQLAEQSLEEHYLYAPWDGSVQRRLLDEGAVVAPGTPILHLVEDGPLEMRVGISPHLAALLSPKSLQRLRTGDREMEVRLSLLAPVTERSSRTREAVFELPPGAGQAGQGAELRLSAEVPGRGFWVPIQSLSQLRKGLWSLLVLTDVDEAESEAEVAQAVVEILHTDRDRAYVDGTLEEGVPVVVSNVAELAVGQRVRFRSTDAAPAKVADNSP